MGLFVGATGGDQEGFPRDLLSSKSPRKRLIQLRRWGKAHAEGTARKGLEAGGEPRNRGNSGFLSRGGASAAPAPSRPPQLPSCRRPLGGASLAPPARWLRGRPAGVFFHRLRSARVPGVVPGRANAHAPPGRQPPRRPPGADRYASGGGRPGAPLPRAPLTVVPPPALGVGARAGLDAGSGRPAVDLRPRACPGSSLRLLLCPLTLQSPLPLSLCLCLSPFWFSFLMTPISLSLPVQALGTQAQPPQAFCPAAWGMTLQLPGPHLAAGSSQTLWSFWGQGRARARVLGSRTETQVGRMRHLGESGSMGGVTPLRNQD